MMALAAPGRCEAERDALPAPKLWAQLGNPIQLLFCYFFSDFSGAFFSLAFPVALEAGDSFLSFFS